MHNNITAIQRDPSYFKPVQPYYCCRFADRIVSSLTNGIREHLLLQKDPAAYQYKQAVSNGDRRIAEYYGPTREERSLTDTIKLRDAGALEAKLKSGNRTHREMLEAARILALEVKKEGISTEDYKQMALVIIENYDHEKPGDCERGRQMDKVNLDKILTSLIQCSDGAGIGYKGPSHTLDRNDSINIASTEVLQAALQSGKLKSLSVDSAIPGSNGSLPKMMILYKRIDLMEALTQALEKPEIESGALQAAFHTCFEAIDYDLDRTLDTDKLEVLKCMVEKLPATMSHWKEVIDDRKIKSYENKIILLNKDLMAHSGKCEQAKMASQIFDALREKAGEPVNNSV